ncbi:site-specific integrase [Nonomuraea basaltis]|uniref:site-specific integrase n=1 Tax=Nonomuraea basaltis TaxID=2495887 RepID=UPI00197CB67E|nr:tyrosine-type recombinase/integrase [Nonomuraea basaltis]
MSRRGNGEGSIYPVPGGYRAFVWVTTPEGVRKRKYVKRKTYDETQQAWKELKAKVEKGPVAVNAPTLAAFLLYWVREVVEPELAPLTASTYETMVRLYITPYLGTKRLDKIQVRDVRLWLNKLRRTCQCCAQGKDARRKVPRCCAAGRCCDQIASERTIKDARGVLRSALNTAISEEIIAKSPVTGVRLSAKRKRKIKPWSVEEARAFLESARRYGDALYAAYVLILVLGLRKGELLGLTWDRVNLDGAELDVSRQLQRVKRQLHHRETKTEASDAVLPLPDVCVAALRLRHKSQEEARQRAGETWIESGFVFTTEHGTPFEPRNFNRRFDTRCRHAGVRKITIHDTRHTCASLLAALDVHPRVAMQILRHSDIKVTMEVYTHIPSEETRKALKRLGDSLGQ